LNGRHKCGRSTACRVGFCRASVPDGDSLAQQLLQRNIHRQAGVIQPGQRPVMRLAQNGV
jgi:hypothetical protein